MDTFLALSLAAGFCTIIGAVLLMMKRRWSPQNLALFLGLAAGVMLAVVGLDMLPNAVELSGFKPTIVGVVIGICCMFAQLKITGNSNRTASSMKRLGYLIMLGIAMHDLPEGMAIALAGSIKEQSGWLIAFGIGIHNIPEGMAIAAPLLMANISKLKIFVQIGLLSFITPLGTLIGQQAAVYLPNLMAPLLGFASGIMLYIVFGQLGPQSFFQDRRHAIFGFFIGWIIIIAATLF